MKLSIDSVTSQRLKSGRRRCEPHSCADGWLGRLFVPAVVSLLVESWKQKRDCKKDYSCDFSRTRGPKVSNAGSSPQFSTPQRLTCKLCKPVEHQNQVHTIASTTASSAEMDISKQSFEHEFIRSQLSERLSAIFAVRFQRDTSLCAGA